MFTRLYENGDPSADGIVAEGEIYKIVTVFGKRFELRYGYYSDIDRSQPPDIIYPDFIENPEYTDEGEPFISLMQDACEQFMGKGARTEDSTCAECVYKKRGEEWFGICRCPAKRKNE